MYTSFRVKNFRGFRDLQLDDLGRVNLIAGQNNTGKTALLEAIYLFAKPLTPTVLFDLQGTRGLDVPAGDNLTTHWKQFFYQLDSTKPIEIVAEFGKLCITEMPISDHDANASTYSQFLKERGMSHSEAFRLANEAKAVLEFRLSKNEGEAHTVYSAPDGIPFAAKYAEQRAHFIPIHGRPDKKTVADQFSQLEISGELPKLIAALQIFEPRLCDLRLLSPDSELIIWGQVNGSRMPLRLMGEGINKVCHFILTMMTNPKSYLFIDEIENGLHYRIQKDVWKVIGQMARALDIQVFATTHSLEMIRAAHEAFEDDEPYEFRYHRLDVNSVTGDIEAVTYNEFGMDAVAAFDFDYEVRG